jgi:hypothetical protein
LGNYLLPGHTFNDGDTVTGPSLTEHVAEATFKTTSVTTQTLKTPAALTDQLLVVASGSFFQETIQQIHDLILYPGCVVQTAYGEYTANSNITTAIPNDDTIPQNTEGVEIINLSITPRFATSLILVRFHGQVTLGGSAPGMVSAALFRDSVVNALGATGTRVEVTDSRVPIALEFQDSPATTSAVAYKIRVGPDAGIARLNGSSTARRYGGASRATLVLQEIKQA